MTSTALIGMAPGRGRLRRGYELPRVRELPPSSPWSRAGDRTRRRLPAGAVAQGDGLAELGASSSRP